MRACEEYEDLVSAFIDGTLAEEDRGRLMEHMASCKACQAYFDDQIAIHDAWDRSEVQPPADLTAAVMEQVRRAPRITVKKRGRVPWQGFAALAACCAAAVLGLWRFQERTGWDQAVEYFSKDACITTDAPAVYAARAVPEEEEEAAPVPEPELPDIAPDITPAATSVPEAGTSDSANTPEAFALPAPGASAEKNSGAAENAEEPLSFFEALPEVFLFSSGAGAWRTELYIAPDGSFTGEFTDTNAGWEGHPAEQYYCNFFGQFSHPVQVDDFTWSAAIEFLELEDTPGDTTYIKSDNLNRIASTPYGLENAGEVFFYLPGAAAEDLPEAFRNWTHAPSEGELDFYGLYNAEEELGFSGYDPS